MINKDSTSSKPSVNKKMAKIRRHGKWYSYQLHTQESAPERPNLKVYTSDDSTVFWTCMYKLKPGCRLHTNGKNYIFKSILVKRGNGVKREVHPVIDPLDPFLTQKADKNKQTKPLVNPPLKSPHATCLIVMETKTCKFKYCKIAYFSCAKTLYAEKESS